MTAARPSTFQAFHDLLANMVEHPLDLLVHEDARALDMVTAQDADQGRLIGKNGANIGALKIIAKWLGFTRVTLAGDIDPRAARKGKLPRVPALTAEPVTMTGQALETLVADLITNLFDAAGSGALAAVKADTQSTPAASELFVDIQISAVASNKPDAITVAALSKVFRAISLRYGHREFFFSCE